MRNTEQKLTIECSGTLVPAALTLPKDTAPAWGVVLVPGSFFNDVDGNYAMRDGNPFEVRPHMYADLARQLSHRGIAVLRYSRAGKTVIDAEKAARAGKFPARADEAAQACRSLRRSVPGLRQIALAGHSEGAAVALLLLTAQTDVRVDAFISLSGPGQKFFDIMIEQSVPNVRDGVLAMMDFKVPFGLFKESFRYIREGQPIPEEIKKLFPPYAIQVMPPQALEYLRDYDRLDPAEAIGKLAVPILIVQGGRDLSVLPENADRLAAGLRGKSTLVSKAFFPELNHFYKFVPPGTPPHLNFGLETETDERIAQAIADWLDRISLNPDPAGGHR
jgi:pimeloyl-ACP methyl ester carboxylesterase